MSNKWTTEEVALLRAEYPSCPSLAELANHMGRTESMLVNKASFEGIRRLKDAFVRSREEAARDSWASGSRGYKTRFKLPERDAVPDLVKAWR